MELNAAHIHLMLNHVPILGFGFGLLLLAWARWRQSEEVVRAVLALFLLVGLTSIAVFFSGESAEDVVEGLAGVSHDAIEVHEEVGEAAMIVSVIVGVLSGLGLVAFRDRAIPRWLTPAAAAAGLVAFGLLTYTGFQGGQIHHQEIRPGGTEGAVEAEARAGSSTASPAWPGPAGAGILEA